MSLLLDALKKAADEKKKDPSPVETNEGEAKDLNEVKDEEMDLNLELSQEQGEEFPEVNQEIIKHIEKQPEIGKEPAKVADEAEIAQEVELAIELEGELEAELQTADTNQKQDLHNNDRVQIKTLNDAEKIDLKSTQTENTLPVDESSPEHKEATDQPEIDNAVQQTPRREQVAEIERKHNHDMEVLSALINKNNEYRDKNQRIISLSIITAILLVLMGAGFYAYIMLDSVEDNRLNPDLVENKPSVVTESLASNVEQAKPKEVGAVKAVVQAPEIKQAGSSNQSTRVKSKPPKPVAKKPIQIRKKTLEDPIGVLLSQAYAAFNKSEYTSSEKLYNKVINRDKNNHDALLGLAAIAVKQGRNNEAKRIYSKLLELDPKDSYAKAGLSTLINQRNAQHNKSQLKIMLREQPRAGHLHFALGNLLLMQRRFAEAQTAFFNAWSTNKSSTDYAYNLAVSLDHLGKPEHAAEFYKLTVKLYEVSGGNVSVDDVKQRIEQIKGKQNG